MSNLSISIDQVIAGVFTLLLIYTSFKGLNQCNKETHMFVRIPLIMFFTGGVGTFLLLSAGHSIHWCHSLIILGLSLHMLMDRRDYHPKPTNQNIPQQR